ncbi:MAG: hypothetical protein LBG27_14300 [Spirochaetaceae bacterium]|nr:hypothetical protein [Spirochaetaceae bacterium]
MGLFPAQRPRFVFVVFLALSVMGTFTFAVRADIPAFDFWKGGPIEGGSIASVDADYTIDCLAEYTGKVRGYLYAPSRKSTHVITPFGSLFAGIIPLSSVIKTAKPTKVPNSKDTILLKLRI